MLVSNPCNNKTKEYFAFKSNNYIFQVGIPFFNLSGSLRIEETGQLRTLLALVCKPVLKGSIENKVLITYLMYIRMPKCIKMWLSMPKDR